VSFGHAGELFGEVSKTEEEPNTEDRRRNEQGLRAEVVEHRYDIPTDFAVSGRSWTLDSKIEKKQNGTHEKRRD
jgi:hypothetical protein